MIDPRLNHAVAIARVGSFTSAAQVVGVTQSAITKSVADLERQLGYQIFHRTSRGAILTEEGREFVDRASRLLDDARALLSGAAIRDPHAGILRIGVCPPSLEWALVDPLLALLDRYPSVRLDISSSSFERVVQLLRTGGVDVAVGFDASFGDWPDLKRQALPALRTILFVRKQHPILSCEQVTAADLARYDFVAPSDCRPYGGVIRDIYESRGIDWQSRMHVIDCFPIVRRIVSTTNAISAVSIPHSRSSSFRKHFETVETGNIFPVAPLCCATRAGATPAPAVRDFIAAVRTSFQHRHHSQE